MSRMRRKKTQWELESTSPFRFDSGRRGPKLGQNSTCDMPEAAVPKPKTLRQPANEDSAQVERRVYVRFSCDLDSACQPLAEPLRLQWQGRICNISRGGTALALARRFDVGTVLAIDMRGEAEEVVRTILARVVRVTFQSDGIWLLGCAFTNPLSEEDLKALLSATHAP